MTAEQIDAEVRRRGPSGFDPVPAIRSLRIPALWVYGGLDMHVATRISVDKLRPIAQEAGRDFSWVVLPGANHSLVQTTQGLNEETRAQTVSRPGSSRRFATGCGRGRSCADGLLKPVRSPRKRGSTVCGSGYSR